MNEIEENFNKQFENKTIWDKIYSRKWEIICLILMISLGLMALGFRDYVNSYSQAYAEWYCYNKFYKSNFTFIKPFNVSK